MIIAQKTPNMDITMIILLICKAVSKNMLELVHGEQPTNYGQQTKYGFTAW